MILTGVYAAGFWWAALIALIPIVIAAGYMLRLFQGIMHGPATARICPNVTISPGTKALRWFRSCWDCCCSVSIRTRLRRSHSIQPTLPPLRRRMERTLLPVAANFATAADIDALLPASIVALTALVALFFDLLAFRPRRAAVLAIVVVATRSGSSLAG